MSEYSVFKPKSARGIFTDYPELRKIQAFSQLANDDMLFVWYYACEASPYFRMSSDRERAREAIDRSYARKGKNGISQEKEEDYLSGKFTAKVTGAIEEMKRYKVGPRVRAMQIVEQGLTNLEHILNIDASDRNNFLNKDGEVDFSKKKAYVDTYAKALDTMDNVIAKLEGRYGLTEENKKSSKDDILSGENVIDNFHDNEK